MTRSKVRERSISLSTVFAGAALGSILVCALLSLAHVELGLTLAFVGLALGLFLPLGLELRTRSSRVRSVVVLDYRMHQYGQAVDRGFRRILASQKRPWHVEYKSTGKSTEDGAVQWQIREVQKAAIDEVDGILLVPADDSEDLWYAVASAIKAGAFVVVVDTKPPNRLFRDIGTETPRFVSARYELTGALTSELLEAWLLADDQRTCVLWTGPDRSWPGEERSRNIVYGLAKRGLLDRAILMPIDSWTPDAERCSQTLDLVTKSSGEVAVYCADDENTMALHLFTLAEAPALRQRMYLIGCNGTPDDYGNVVALDMLAADATVDILAEEQGAQAALFFVRERTGRLSEGERSRYIEPKVLLRSGSKGRWLESFFDRHADDTAGSVVLLEAKAEGASTHPDYPAETEAAELAEDGG